MVPDLSSGSRLLVVVAHPDDESFGCGSALLLAGAAGVTTLLACATRGEAGEAVPGAVDTARGDSLGTVRERELRAAAAVLGVARVDVWGFADSGMAGPAPAGSLAATDPDDLAQAVGRCVDGARPDALLTLDASDGHRDHLALRTAVETVGREASLPTYLSCLPRSLMARWADHVARTERDSAYLALGELGTPDAELTHVLDAGAHLARREAAIAAHHSQASPFEDLPDDLRRAFLATVHLRQVQTT